MEKLISPNLETLGWSLSDDEANSLAVVIRAYMDIVIVDYNPGDEDGLQTMRDALDVLDNYASELENGSRILPDEFMTEAKGFVRRCVDLYFGVKSRILRADLCRKYDINEDDFKSSLIELTTMFDASNQGLSIRAS